jgi:hypothetical protein
MLPPEALNMARRILALLIPLVLTLSSPAMAARPAVTGTWIGALPVGGIDRPVVAQLHQRADGTVMGYLLGGTSGRVVTRGSFSGGKLSLQILKTDPENTSRVTVQAQLHGRAGLRGTAREGAGAARSISWTRTTSSITERQFLFLGGTEEDVLTEVAVAIDGSGRLLTGAWVSQGNACGLFGCNGIVTSFSESGGALRIGIASGGACPATAVLNGTFDAAARAYQGTFSRTGCPGMAPGPLLGARWTRSRSPEMAGVFAALGRFADDLEAGSAFTAPHPAVSPAYLHFGTRTPDFLAGLREEVARYADIQVDFHSFRGFNTAPDPLTFPDVAKPAGVDFHDWRASEPASGGPAFVYQDVETSLLHSEIRHLRLEGGGWKIAGNQSEPLDLPFRYEVAGASMTSPSPGGGVVYLSPGPWGSHFTPLAGHAYGDPKPNFAGFFSKDDFDRREILGDGTGDEDLLCEPGEACAWDGGPGGERIRSRTPVYVAPLAGSITSVEYRGPSPAYFDGVQRWGVRLHLNLGMELNLDHLARIAPALRDAILAHTGVDTDTYAGPTGDILHGVHIPVAAGTELALPQVFASEVPGNPGLYRGGGTFGDRPWAEMEFFSNEDGRTLCYYGLLPQERRARIQAVLDAEMTDPASQRYGAYQPLRWTWAAEGLLCPGETASGPAAPLLTHRGGWFKSGPTDELFSIVRIARESASYDPSLYSSDRVELLALRRRRDGAPFSWTLPGSASASTVFYPNAEVLGVTPSSLLLRWRDVGPSPVFQRAAWLLANGKLKIRWGAFAATAAAAALPTLDPAAPCDGTEIVCYDQVNRPGF